MKWQAITRFVPAKLGHAGLRASWIALGALATLRFVACSADGGQQLGPALVTQPVCGNGVLETGEGCDGLVQTTCAAISMGVKPVGMVRCTNFCQLDFSDCHSAGSGGAPAAAGAP